ncbi:AMP-binding enzyme [Pseudaquabacterium terrae]|uniref:AMP-binding enzyme n=1 Tax=Pseudaquabacterium terrae TaxID=2732868 RepID=UPI0024844B0F|nr:hypothetical protein [Aquabacterium terrae]
MASGSARGSGRGRRRGARRTGPAEIEALLMGTGLLEDAATIGVPDPVKGTAVVCLCVARPDTDRDAPVKVANGHCTQRESTRRHSTSSSNWEREAGRAEGRRRACQYSQGKPEDDWPAAV